jgi:hypothetical protein
MNPELQTLLTVSIPTIAVLIGILVNNTRLNDTNVRIAELRSHVDQRIDDLKDILQADIRRVEGVLDTRLQHVEERIR